MIVDAHMDLPGEILYRITNGEMNIIKKYYLDRWLRSGVSIIIASVFVESQMLPEMGLRNALKQIMVMKKEICDNKELVLVTCKKELESAIKSGKIGIILYIEGLDCIGNDIEIIDILYELGVRGAALTWSRDNFLAHGSCRASENFDTSGGLTRTGLKVIKRMEELEMFVDVSHLNDEGLSMVYKVAKRPFLATHSNSRRIHFHYRNLTDEQIIRIVNSGGVIGVNGCKMLLGTSKKEGSFEKMCEHIEYIGKIAGIEHVGIGLDLCDNYDCARFRRRYPENGEDLLNNHEKIHEVGEMLMARGMSKEAVAGVLGDNFINYLKTNLPD